MKRAIPYTPPMQLRFTKMHGLGNDFIVFDAPSDDAVPGNETMRKLADRRTGMEAGDEASGSRGGAVTKFKGVTNHRCATVSRPSHVVRERCGRETAPQPVARETKFSVNRHALRATWRAILMDDQLTLPARVPAEVAARAAAICFVGRAIVAPQE